MNKFSAMVIVAVATLLLAGCRVPASLRGGPCAATRRPVIAPWARHWTTPQPTAVVVPPPAYSSSCGSPVVAAPGCGSSGTVISGTSVYDSDVPLYEVAPSPGAGIPLQPMPPTGNGPEAGGVPGS